MARMIKIITNSSVTLFKLIVGLNVLLFTSVVNAEVELPLGVYHQTTDDLVVKVKGGFVRASRTWYEEKEIKRNQGVSTLEK